MPNRVGSPGYGSHRPWRLGEHSVTQLVYEVAMDDNIGAHFSPRASELGPRVEPRLRLSGR